jgi:hypothetical protein
MNDWRLKYVVLSLFSAASLVFLFWAYQNAMFSVPAENPTFYEQRAVVHFNQAMAIAIVGAGLFIGLLIRDRYAAGKEITDRLLLHLSTWGPFVLTTLLTLVVDAMGWRLSAWFWPLSMLGLMSLLSGIWAIWHTRGRLWPILVVLAGLIIGQLWFIQFASIS